MIIVKANSALMQPKDRDYNRKGLKREEHLEVKDDEIAHALITRGNLFVVIEYDMSKDIKELNND